MKKIIILLLLSIILIFSVYADDNEKESFRISDRTFEIGLLNMSFGFSNDFLGLKDIFQETLTIDLDKLQKGFKMNLGLSLTPFYFSYNNNNKWGFGLSTNLSATGFIGISGNILSFNNTVNDKSEIGGAAFAEVAGNVFFTVKDFIIKVKPSMFYPIFYIEPDISYTFDNKNDETELNVKYLIRMYTAGSMENFLENPGINATPGFDFHIGVSYPLSKFIGFLDFDVGVDLINLPFIPASMLDYMEISGRIGTDGYVNIFDILNNGDVDLIDTGDVVYGTDVITFIRPFKMFAWADWRVFGNRLLSFRPKVGFAISPLYIKPFVLEGGADVCLDLANILITTAGINYEDRLWKNSLNIALNLRAFEIDLGVELRSPDFLKSWDAAGFGASLGFKFGW